MPAGLQNKYMFQLVKAFFTDFAKPFFRVSKAFFKGSHPFSKRKGPEICFVYSHGWAKLHSKSLDLVRQARWVLPIWSCRCWNESQSHHMRCLRGPWKSPCKHLPVEGFFSLCLSIWNCKFITSFPLFSAYTAFRKDRSRKKALKEDRRPLKSPKQKIRNDYKTP